VENNLIEIEDLMVQPDKLFVDSKWKQIEGFSEKKNYRNNLLKKHQVMENFVDVVMIV
jgi:hypothetical protein